MLCEFSSYIGRLLDQRDIALEVVQQSEREDWIQTFVRADFGVAFMPLSIARGANLAYVLTSDCPIVRNVGVFVQAERPVTTNQPLVIDLLATHDWGRARAVTPS